VPASNILLLESDATSGEAIRSVLTRAGYGVASVQDADSLIRQAPQQQLLIVDVVSGSKTAQEICRELRGVPALAKVPILCISQTDDVEERIRFLEAGADDVMAKPFDARELEARAEALLLRFQRSRDLTPLGVSAGADARRVRRVIAVYSPKGGVGTTTIAVNVATVAAQLHPERTLLIDLDLQFGQVATHLNLPAQRSVADLARDEEALRDIDGLRPYIESLETGGLSVIPAPGSPEIAQLITGKHVERLIATAATGFDVIVVDAGSSLDERTLALFEIADAIIMPLIAELGALKAMSILLDYLNETGSVPSKTMFVLNDVFSRELLKSSDIETALGTKMALELPYDALLYVKAINEGVPIVTGAPKSAAADRLTKLATMALGTGVAQITPPTPEKRRGLSGLLRRA
jgi:pilus assembly protein CpaE